MYKPITAAAKERIARFIAEESSGGIVMLLAAAAALLAANSPLQDTYDALIHYPLSLGGASHSLAHWVSEWGMVLFFFLVGMELKRERTSGVLQDTSQVVLPLAAALGGMAVPALLYGAFNLGIPANAAGWAIPTATDIAFALAVLLLAAKNTPSSLKIFLLTLAIFDDLGAILIIALFYSDALAWVPLAAAAGLTALLAVLHQRRVAALWPYLLLGAALCLALAEAGIHATIGGVVAGLLIPHRTADANATAPLERGLHGLHPWVAFLLLPLFAFTAAGMPIGAAEFAYLDEPLTLGIMAGLFLGKPLGIMAACGLMIKSGRASLPEEASWKQLYAIATLAGIGFTMSLFIAGLAFVDAAQLAAAKLGILAASVLAAIAGVLLLKCAARGR